MIFLSLLIIIFVSTFWFQTARLYDVSQNAPKATFNFEAACLSCCLKDDDVGFAGGLDKSVKSLDLIKGSSLIIGSHQEAISCINWSSTSNILFTGGWDGNVKSWDTRKSGTLSNISCSERVYSMSLTDTRVVIATANRQILIYDARNLNVPEQIRESPLKFQTRKISCFPDGSGFAIGSIEVRCRFIRAYAQIVTSYR